MAQTSGGWDNDGEDEEQGYSAEEMDIDAAAGGSAAVSGAFAHHHTLVCLEIEIFKLTNVPAGGRFLRQVPPFDLPSHCFSLCAYVTGNLHNDKLSVHTAAVLRHVLRCGPCLQALKLATAMMMLSQTGQMRMRMRTWRSVIDTGCEQLQRFH